MCQPERFLKDGEGSLEELLSFPISARRLVHRCQIIESRGDVGMLGPEGLLFDGQRPPIKGVDIDVLALETLEPGQGVRADSHERLLRSERLLNDRKRSEQRRLRL